MQGDLVCASEVDALDDIYLAAVGPVWAKEPKGGPDATNGTRHMGDVGNEEAVSIGFVAANSNGGPACRGIHGGMVNAEINLTVVRVDETLARSGGLRLIGYIAMSGIRARVEAEG